MRARQHDRFVLIGLCWLYGRSEFPPPPWSILVLSCILLDCAFQLEVWLTRTPGIFIGSLAPSCSLIPSARLNLCTRAVFIANLFALRLRLGRCNALPVRCWDPVVQTGMFMSWRKLKQVLKMTRIHQQHLTEICTLEWPVQILQPVWYSMP